MLKTKTLDNIITEHEKITQFRIIACKGGKKNLPKNNTSFTNNTKQNKTKNTKKTNTQKNYSNSKEISREFM